MMRRRPKEKPFEFQGIFTVSKEMEAFFETLEKASRSEASILIRGETGTGKELVARAIHQLSRRRERPMASVNCASLMGEMLSSELFGHVKGAFTGAIKDRTGLLRTAHTGSLFLDEIAEMPLDIQARLLRVLQERNFVPLGGTKDVSVDVRLISATHRSLRRAVDDNTFRSDLMFRVRVLPIFLPALRERSGDIEALSWLFLEEFCEREGDFNIRGIQNNAFDALMAYSWPGNIRELRNVMEYAVVMATHDVITLEELPPELRGELPLEDRSPEDEGEIRQALADARGDREIAAQSLGMSRSTLWRKMREAQIEWPRKKRRA